MKKSPMKKSDKMTNNLLHRLLIFCENLQNFTLTNYVSLTLKVVISRNTQVKWNIQGWVKKSSLEKLIGLNLND